MTRQSILTYQTYSEVHKKIKQFETRKFIISLYLHKYIVNTVSSAINGFIIHVFKLLLELNHVFTVFKNFESVESTDYIRKQQKQNYSVKKI